MPGGKARCDFEMAVMVIESKRARTSVGVVLAVGALYGGIRLLVDLPFMEYCFGAPFLPGLAFYHRFSGYVGGPVQYAANLFSQTYYRPWVGTLALTTLVFACGSVARGVLRYFSRASCNLPAIVFSLLMLLGAGRYIAVVYVLPMTAGLAAAWLYMAMRSAGAESRATVTGSAGNSTHWRQSGWLQITGIGLFFLASIPVHYLLASGFLYFSVVCALYELILARRLSLGLAWVGAAAAIPSGFSYFLYEPDALARYCRWIAMPESDSLVTCLLISFYAFVPAGAVTSFLAERIACRRRFRAVAGRIVRVAGVGVVILLVAELVALRLDRSGWIYADFLVATGHADEALATLRGVPESGDFVRFLTLHALIRTGRLPWEMFHYPQRRSSEALLLRDPKWDLFPRVTDHRSDIYFELGRINEAERWAHESLAVEGERPDILERIAVTNVLNGRPDAAKVFFNALTKVLFHAQRARDYLRRLERDPALKDDETLRHIRPLMLHTDYVGNWSTEKMFRQSLEVDPSNRMAFEYLLAHYLLNCDMRGLGQLAVRFKDFYPVLPTHVQEALLVYRHANGAWPPGLENYSPERQMESRFEAFLAALAEHQDDAQGSWDAVAADFGATYWFFDFFGRTAAGPRADPAVAKPKEDRP